MSHVSPRAPTTFIWTLGKTDANVACRSNEIVGISREPRNKTVLSPSYKSGSNYCRHTWWKGYFVLIGIGRTGGRRREGVAVSQSAAAAVAGVRET